MIDVGRMNKRIKFYNQVDVDNPVHEQTDQQLQFYKELWASVEPTKGDEIIEADRREDVLYYTIHMRYRKDITGDMIIEYKGQKLEIISPPINWWEEDVLLKIFCRYTVGDTIE